jgi:hypothetical protein
VAKFMEKLEVSKKKRKGVHMEWFNLKKLNEVEGEYSAEISKRFPA